MGTASRSWHSVQSDAPRSLRALLLMVLATASLLPATPPRAAAQDWRSWKTLTAWRAASDAPEEEPDEEEDSLVTDRPHVSEASSLVGLGRVQLETGYTYFLDREDGVTVQRHSFPEPLLRAGLFAEWFELRLGWNYLVEQTSPLPGGGRQDGADDMYVGAKLALTEQAGWLPEMAIFPQMRVPTGSRYFTNHEVLPGFNLAYSWKLNDWLELECNTQSNRRRDDVGHFYTEWFQSANVEYQLTDRIGAFTEWFVTMPSGALAAGTQHYFHGGFVYLVTRDIQLDIHSAIGLSRASDDLAFTGVGFSVRY